MASSRKSKMLSVILSTLVLVACGSEVGVPAAAPSTASAPDIVISRDEAIEIAIGRMTKGGGTSGRSSATVRNPRDITVRFMSVADYHIGGGSGSFSGTGYIASGYLWVVQARVDGQSAISDNSSGYRPTRYAVEAVVARSGQQSASARIVDEPMFISAEFADDVYELNFPANPLTPTNISRDRARQIIRDKYDFDSSESVTENFRNMELEIVHSAEQGLLWWVFTPSELRTTPCGGPSMDDGRHFLCWDTGFWEFVDADTGDIYQGRNSGKIGPRATNEESQALFRFAQAEGWWGLWHRLCRSISR